MWIPGRARDDGARFTEIYARALDQLADPRPPMRIGALHTFDMLGQENPRHRQAIVDVICAYLRMPGDDRSVRQAAQAMLTRHLNPTGAFWSQISLDLTGAALSDLDLSGCRIDGFLRLAHATLGGPARFRGLVVGGFADLRGTTFRDHAWLERSVFRGQCRFDGAVFHGDAWFGGATFAARTGFLAATFTGHAWFGACTFRGPVDFGSAVFRRSAGFRGAAAEGEVGLTGTTFLGVARVSRRDDVWNIHAPGWRVVVDPDNESVGQLLWVGTASEANTLSPI
jgi:hypothetical protein